MRAIDIDNLQRRFQGSGSRDTPVGSLQQSQQELQMWYSPSPQKLVGVGENQWDTPPPARETILVGTDELLDGCLPEGEQPEVRRMKNDKLAFVVGTFHDTCRYALRQLQNRPSQQYHSRKPVWNRSGR